MLLPLQPRHWKLVLGVLGLIATIGLLKVGARAWFETLGSFHSDVAIYMTVSRGMLHGLTPYIDLFENKAPGVFLLGALSLLLTSGVALLSWIQAFAILLFPFTLALPFLARWHWKAIDATTLFGWIVGCVLALYIAAMSGQLLPESFGALPAATLVAYLFVLERQEAAYTWKQIILIGLLLLTAAGIKEPFFLSIVGGVLVLLPWKRAWNALSLPFAIALGIGLIGLLLLGQFGAYVGVHLAHMLGYHVLHPWGTLDEPLWLRLIDVWRLWVNLSSYSPLLPWIITLLWIGALGRLLMDAANRRERISAAVRWIAGTLLNTMAVGLTGDFYSHHFVFAIPLFVACFFVCVRPGGTELWLKLREIGMWIISILAALILILAPFRYDALYEEWESWARPEQRAAAVLDRVMDRCQIDRYFLFIDRPEGFYGFPKHLPYGPIFTQYSRFIGALPQYVDSFANALQTAPIMVIKTKEEGVPVDPETLQFLYGSFTQTPWPCAGAVETTPPFHILFRTVGNQTPPL